MERDPSSRLRDQPCLARLTAASFGVRRVSDRRKKQIAHQVKRMVTEGIRIDGGKFVWPARIDPDAWTEFRPSDSGAGRPFDKISPVEIANAIRFLKARHPGIAAADLDAATLRTFGRRRQTKGIVAHLANAKALA